MGAPYYFDIVAEDGRYLRQVADCPPNAKHVLALRGAYRIPILSVFLRNMWAKKHGARFYSE